jgi:hypothetical protein
VGRDRAILDPYMVDYRAEVGDHSMVEESNIGWSGCRAMAA